MIRVNLIGSQRTLREKRTVWERERIRAFTPEEKAAHRARHREHDRKRDADPARRQRVLGAARRHRLRGFGLTVEAYDRLVAAQGDVCACCGKGDPGCGRTLWCIDHDHKTGVIRGLLCNNCNAGIGILGDTIEAVRAALAYLERTGAS